MKKTNGTHEKGPSANRGFHVHKILTVMGDDTVDGIRYMGEDMLDMSIDSGWGNRN